MKTIKELRTERGWTQKELGDKLGITAVSVYNWERGEHMPTVIQFRRLAELFGVPMEDIALVGVDVERQ